MTEIESIRMQKQSVRERMRSEREKLSGQDALSAGTKIIEMILSGAVEGITVNKGSMLGLYVSDRNEPDFSGMLDTLRSKDIRFCFPAVRSGAIGFFSLPPAGEFITGELGILEPGDTAVPIQPEEIDIILVPGMAFDSGGGRLGRGKGLFDKYLAGIPEDRRPILVGTGHDFQFLEHVPIEVTDIPMDYIVTPTRYLRTMPAGSRNAGSPFDSEAIQRQ
jgi:5-formyltetrahydrofolate cyclo-ligase